MTEKTQLAVKSAVT